MKLQHQKVRPQLRSTLIVRLFTALVKDKVNDFDISNGTHIAALTDEFRHTTNIDEARWLYSTNERGTAVIRINNDGSMTHITEER